VHTVDVVVVGAGLAGVGMAARLRRAHPELELVVLEGRSAIGGTWDLFRYPGVRSDSDMHTLGYPFRPWTDERSIAPAGVIRDYVRSTAEAEGLLPLIRFGQRVTGAAWSSADGRWRVEVSGGEPVECRFLVLCTGYYRYEAGYTPEFPGLDDFAGRLVHPQHWPEGLDVAGRRVVVVGSGATAVTLVPALAEAGARVTMLQRSPSYVGAVASRDAFARRVGRMLPPAAAHRVVRAKNVAVSTAIYRFARLRPAAMRAILLRRAAAALPAGFDLGHFSPRYDPWDERLCAVPDGDLFGALSGGRAEVVTDRIARVVPEGVELVSGRMLGADVLVTATGLVLQPLGGIRLTVDGDPVDVSTSYAYRGMMLSGVPNLAFTIGYVNASWTLKTDLVARYVTRLITRLARTGAASVTPQPPPEARAPASATAEGAPAPVPGEAEPMLGLASGYFRRGTHLLPRRGRRGPWRVHQDYLRDVLSLAHGSLRRGLRYR
jgi:cation diffusion facilitator CzcD-associated flavoprotein CzcO